MVNYLQQTGNSINIHSFSHTTSMATTLPTWAVEESTDITNLQKLASIPKPRGSRAPYLQINDSYFAEISTIVEFDSSMPITLPLGQQPYWPFTLDYGVPDPAMCNIDGVCPKKNYNGVWEFPMINLDSSNTSNVMDPYISNYASLMNMFKQNFLNSYNGTNAVRAPRGVYWHWRYLTTDGNFAALDTTKAQFLTDFFQWVSTIPNVIFTTEEHVLDWMKNPVPYSQTVLLPQFQCAASLPNLNPTNSCPGGVTSCLYGIDVVSVCGPACPDNWPGLGISWNYISNVNPGNTNKALTHWPGTVALTSVQGSQTSFCANIKATNPSGSPVAVAFVLTVLSCPTLDYGAWSNYGTWGSAVSYFNKGANQGFTIVGSNDPDPSPAPNAVIKIAAGGSAIVAGFCLDSVATKYTRTNNLRFGIDFYSANVNCEVSHCAKFCGDGVCTGPKETSTSCPIDCKAMTCPTSRRLLWNRNF